MNINSIRAVDSCSAFAVKVISEAEVSSTAVEVPWGFYIASRQQRILTRATTVSIASCIAYIFWDKGNQNFLFAHVSSDGEACSVVNLVKELTGERYSSEAYFVCVVGKSPSAPTYARVNHIIENIGQNHRCVRTDTGGVTVDIAQETLIKTNGPVAKIKAIPEQEKIAALSKGRGEPLNPIQVSSSWTGGTGGGCPAMAGVRGRSTSLV
ncbi:hypothetical protein A9Q99_25105 [Gammaproteobacteria bacterium 45_16_T64]|nr:hypothetical protein A9Q99_25105 [Gammaproteobacteria bacterium 45_16_T64]